MSSLVAIVGPTAIGKSGLALELCQTFAGEIINADSRQVYRYMDIGTSKPTLEDQSRVAHHVIDVVNPDQDFSLAIYQIKALKAIQDIQQRNKTSFLVGGSGLYVWSILEEWQIPPVPPDYALRQELEYRALSEGSGALFQELIQLDPNAAQQIDHNNIRRIVRALEVCYQGIPFSQLKEKKASANWLIIGLTTSRTNLYQQIDDRVDQMMERGLLSEVEALAARGYSFDLPAMSALGYKQLGLFIQGKTDLNNAVKRIKFDTHRFVRHQYNWFSLQDKRIHWFDDSEEKGQTIHHIVKQFVANQYNHQLHT